MAKRNPEAQPSAPSAQLMPPQLMPAVSQFKWNPSLQTGPIQAKILQFWPNKSTNHLKEQADLLQEIIFHRHKTNTPPQPLLSH